MWWGLANNLILVTCCGYAWIAGGRIEKIGAATIFTASLLTWVALRLTAGLHQTINFGVLTVDIALLGGLVWLALASNRYWALWASGFHLVGVITHIAMAVNRDATPAAYAHGIGVWGYLLFLSIAIGAFLENRRAYSRADT